MKSETAMSLLPITPELIAQHGLKPEEYDLLVDRIGRVPNLVELGIFSAMWSEHCSYKSSRRHLKKFPTEGACVLQGPGENAGVIDLGDGHAAVFKMESHNHPSYIEPYQGAATGVGGIMRDVFTMGARPVALLNALRFGEPSHPKTRSLLAGVVAGIGGYGNCTGIPTIAGETNFHKGYNGNILVNAMCVGLADKEKIFLSAAPGPDLPVLYVGSQTGRDGIHGASMASSEFDEGTDEKRPTVQVGDPFIEKLLIEACLDLMAEDAIAAIQDMGAAGLTSSAVEMAGKGGVGIDLNLDAVPQRESGMTPYEMMLSESQERMLIILKPGAEERAQSIFAKWDLEAALIGRTTTTGRLVLTHKGETVCDLPLAPLSEDAPLYDRPWQETAPQPVIKPEDVEEPKDYAEAFLALLQSPDIASKRWIWEQYDRHVMNDTVDSSQSQGDAGIVRVHGTQKALAVTSDCTPRYCQADPFEGGKQAVVEAWRNLTAVGAQPLAMTNCLNFGNPERPEIMGQIVGCIDGMTAACEALDFPVVSGNVSLYNETQGTAIAPTPVVGGVGLLSDPERRAAPYRMQEGDKLILIGACEGWLGSSLYRSELLGEETGAPPPVDPETEKRHGDYVRRLICEGQADAVHDLSDGGLLIAAAEMALSSDTGVVLERPEALKSVPLHGFLFGEDQGRYLLAVRSEGADGILKTAQEQNIPSVIIGRAGGEDLVFADVSVSLQTARHIHEAWLPQLMDMTEEGSG